MNKNFTNNSKTIIGEKEIVLATLYGEKIWKWIEYSETKDI